MSDRDDIIDQALASLHRRFGLAPTAQSFVVDPETGEYAGIRLGDRVQQRLDPSTDRAPAAGFVVEILPDAVVIPEFRRRHGKLVVDGQMLTREALDVALVDKAELRTTARHRTARQIAEVIATGSGVWRLSDYRRLVWIIALLGTEKVSAL